MSRYRFISAERGHYPVRRLCQVLGVPTSSFYAWQAEQQRAFQDMASKYVVGWHVMATMPEELVNAALQRAF